MSVSELQRGLLEALFVRRNTSRLPRFVTDEHRLHQGFVPEPIVGSAGLALFFKRLWTVFMDGSLEKIEVVAGDNRALTRALVSLRHTGDVGAVPATHGYWKLDLMLLSSVHSSGRLQESWVETNALSLLSQHRAWRVPPATIDEEAVGARAKASSSKGAAQ